MKKLLSGILFLLIICSGLMAEGTVEFDIKGGFDNYRNNFIFKDENGSLCELDYIDKSNSGLFDLLVLDIYAELSNSHNFSTYLGCGLGCTYPGLTLYFSFAGSYDIYAGKLLIEPMLSADIGITEHTDPDEDTSEDYLYTKASFDITVGKATKEGLYLVTGINYKHNFNFYEFSMIPIGFEAGIGYRF